MEGDEKGGRESFLFFRRLDFSFRFVSLNHDLDRYQFKIPKNSAPRRLASAAEEKESGGALQKRKNKKIKKFSTATKRVAGPVTVVALDAALASPTGATRELIVFSFVFRRF